MGIILIGFNWIELELELYYLQMNYLIRVEKFNLKNIFDWTDLPGDCIFLFLPGKTPTEFPLGTINTHGIRYNFNHQIQGMNHSHGF